MVARTRRGRQNFDLWPGFVDALAGLVIIVLFVLMVFMTAQFFLSDMLMGRDRTISRLQSRISELARMLSLEQEESEEAQRRIDEIMAELRATIEARNVLRQEREQLQQRSLTLQGQLAAQEEATREQRQRAQDLLGRLEAQRQATEEEQQRAENLRGRLESQQQAAQEQREETERQRQARLSAEQQLELLNLQIAELRRQLSAVQEALEASEATREHQELRIERLGERLNAALATQVQRLQRYRSDFFGRLREVLGDRSNIRIVGDRFVFQSEVLFPSGSDNLQPGGEEQLAQVAETLKEIMGEIPDDIDWVLRVDGHTDIRPIRAGATFSDNWDLSAARAIAVVKFFIDQGIPAERLIAAGFGPNHPLDENRTDAAFAKNRRIELKITQR